jgi:methyl-accepting chemotaxis protein
VQQSFGSSLLGRVSIGRRLAGAFLAFTVLMVLMAGVGAWRLAGLNEVTLEMASVNLRVERVVGAWFAETKSNSVRAVVLTHTDDAQLKRILTPQLEATSARISELQKEVEGLMDSPEAKALFAQIGTKRSAYLELRKAVLEKKKAGENEEALALLNTAMLPAADAYVASIKKLVDHYSAEVERDAALAAASATSGRNVLLGACLVGVLLGVLLSWWITLSITAPLR